MGRNKVTPPTLLMWNPASAQWVQLLLLPFPLPETQFSCEMNHEIFSNTSIISPRYMGAAILLGNTLRYGCHVINFFCHAMWHNSCVTWHIRSMGCNIQKLERQILDNLQIKAQRINKKDMIIALLIKTIVQNKETNPRNGRTILDLALSKYARSSVKTPQHWRATCECFHWSVWATYKNCWNTLSNRMFEIGAIYQLISYDPLNHDFVWCGSDQIDIDSSFVMVRQKYFSSPSVTILNQVWFFQSH